MLVVLQPAEEVGQGRAGDARERSLDDARAIFGGHVDRRFTVGQVVADDGPLAASADTFEIEMIGAGAHAARPHESRDPIVASAPIVSALRRSSRAGSIRRRRVSSRSGRSTRGRRRTSFPIGRCTGTIRAVDRVARADARRGAARDGVDRVGVRRRRRVSPSIAERRRSSIPPEQAGWAREAASAVVGTDNVVPLGFLNLAGEDFAHYMERIPGCFLRIGAREPGGAVIPAHSPTFAPAEESLVRRRRGARGMRARRLAVHPINSLIVQTARKLVCIAAAPVALACGGDSMSPSNGPPAHSSPRSRISIARRSSVRRSPAGSSSTSPTRPAARCRVRPSRSPSPAGNGATSPRIATTGSNGQATAAWTLGTIAGRQRGHGERERCRDGASPFTRRARPVPRRRCRCRPQSAAHARERRLSADHGGEPRHVRQRRPLRAQRCCARSDAHQHRCDRGCARSASRLGDVRRRDVRGKSDSVLVTVLAVGQSICTGAASAARPRRRTGVTDVSGDGFCVHALEPGRRVRDRPVLQLRRAERDDHRRGARAGTLAAVASVGRGVQRGTRRVTEPQDRRSSRRRVRDASARTRARQEAARRLRRAAVAGARASTRRARRRHRRCPRSAT